MPRENDRAVTLLERTPKFTARGGMFYIDFGTEGMPLVAVSPAIMLKVIGRARIAFDTWNADQRNRIS